jgi:hypothetical protein
LYDVSTVWTANSGLSAGALYAVYDVNYNSLGYGLVNQQAAPNQFTADGVDWNRLGTYLVPGVLGQPTTVLRVILWNSNAPGQVCADAIRIQSVPGG